MIESDIDKYQSHIDSWLKKIEKMGSTVAKIKSTRDPLKLKASNIYKLREYLQKEIKKNK